MKNLIKVLFFFLSQNAMAQSITITPESQNMLELNGHAARQKLLVTTNQISGIEFYRKGNNSDELKGGLWYNEAYKTLDLSSSSGLNGLSYNINENLVGINTRSTLGQLTISANNYYNPHLTLEGPSTELRFSETAGNQFWSIKTANKYGSGDYFNIGKTNSTKLSISHEGNVGIGTSGHLLDEKLHVRGGKIKLEDTEPNLVLNANGTLHRGGIQFTDENDQVKGELKFDLNKLQLTNGNTTGIIVNNDVGINTVPDAKAELTVAGTATNITDNTVVQIRSGSQKMLLDGSSINVNNGKFSINGISNNYVTIGSDTFLDSESHQTEINGYTALGLNSPLIKTKKSTAQIGTNSIQSVLMGISYTKVLDVKVVLRDEDNSKVYLPNNSNVDFSFDVVYSNSSVRLENIGSSLQGMEASVYLTYEK